MSAPYFVYILASKRNGTLYIGVTNELGRRVWQHREGIASAFTRKYGVTMLVYFETFDVVEDAIQRENAIEEMESAVEARVGRRGESELERSLCERRDCVNDFWVARSCRAMTQLFLVRPFE